MRTVPNGHSPCVPGLAQSAAASRVVVAPDPSFATASLRFEGVYEEHFEFVFRSARRLGVEMDALDDIVQETFLVVHRRLGDFAGRSSIKTWLFGILRHVVANHRRTLRRKNEGTRREDPEGLESIGLEAASPHDEAARSEALRTLYDLLDSLDDEKREVFVLAELEQMTTPEIAEAIGQNPNTISTRLRAARQEFEKAVERRRARDARRSG